MVKNQGYFHGRMPAILLKEEWLDPDNHDTNGLKELLKPFPDDGMDYYQVRKAVNKCEE